MSSKFRIDRTETILNSQPYWDDIHLQIGFSLVVPSLTQLTHAAVFNFAAADENCAEKLRICVVHGSGDIGRDQAQNHDELATSMYVWPLQAPAWQDCCYRSLSRFGKTKCHKL